jgi:hypothetical protein
MTIVVAAATLAAAACGGSSTSKPLAAPPAAALPTSSSSHVAIVVMENKEATDVVGTASSPYVTALARKYAIASRAYAIAHPSLPNYLALTSGSTHDITDDCTDCHVAAPNIVDQLEAAGLSWKAYMEDLPHPCPGAATAGGYAKKHNPFILESTSSGTATAVNTNDTVTTANASAASPPASATSPAVAISPGARPNAINPSCGHPRTVCPVQRQPAATPRAAAAPPPRPSATLPPFSATEPARSSEPRPRPGPRG